MRGAFFTLCQTYNRFYSPLWEPMSGEIFVFIIESLFNLGFKWQNNKMISLLDTTALFVRCQWNHNFTSKSHTLFMGFRQLYQHRRLRKDKEWNNENRLCPNPFALFSSNNVRHISWKRFEKNPHFSARSTKQGGVCVLMGLANLLNTNTDISGTTIRFQKQTPHNNSRPLKSQIMCALTTSLFIKAHPITNWEMDFFVFCLKQ